LEDSRREEAADRFIALLEDGTPEKIGHVATLPLLVDPTAASTLSLAVIARMSGSRSRDDRLSAPQAALDALLAGPAGDPLRRALWLDAWDLRLRSCLPQELVAHARLANIESGRLVFLVDAPVWRAKLRLVAAEVLDAARSLGLDVTDLTVKTTVTPLIAKPSRVERTVKPMSTASRDALRAALDSLQDPDSAGSGESS